VSEQENLQTVQRVYKAFAEGDIAAMLKFLTAFKLWRRRQAV